MSQDLPAISDDVHERITGLPAPDLSGNHTINLAEGLTQGQLVSLINGQEIYLNTDISGSTDVGTYGGAQIISAHTGGDESDIQRMVDQAIHDGQPVENVIFTIDQGTGNTVQDLAGDQFLQSLDTSLPIGLQIDEHGQIIAVGDDGQARVVHIEIQQQDQENVPPITISDEKSVFTPLQVPLTRKPGDPYKCDVCEQEFSKWGVLQRHIRQHDEEKPHQCSECQLSFNFEVNLKLHQATHDTDNPRCPVCGKSFSRVASLKSHLLLHAREEFLICAECGDEFEHQRQLDRHMKEHRGEMVEDRIRPVKPATVYTCKHCGLTCNKVAEFRQHTRIHRKFNEATSRRKYTRNPDRSAFNYECDQCKKTFNKPSLLSRHMRIHTGERPFKCKYCGKAFNQKGALQVHVSAKHGGKKEYVCTFCGHAYAQSGNLRAHIQRCHEVPSDPNETRYSCEACPCSFKKLGSLNAHISKTHGDLEIAQEEVRVPVGEGGSSHLLAVSQDESLTHDSIGEGPRFQTPALSSDLLQQALSHSGLQNQQEHEQQLQNPPQQQYQNQTQVEQHQQKSVGQQEASGGPKEASQSATLPDMGQSLVTQSEGDSVPHAIRSEVVYRRVVRKANGIRWHQCSFCAKEFKKPSDLVRHIRIHTHEKPYKCTLCFRAFAILRSSVGSS